jgi:hypothetical protein
MLAVGAAAGVPALAGAAIGADHLDAGLFALIAEAEAAEARAAFADDDEVDAMRRRVGLMQAKTLEGIIAKLLFVAPCLEPADFEEESSWVYAVVFSAALDAERLQPAPAAA